MSNLHIVWGELLLDALAEAGVRQVVVSPGSRSTPLVLAAARHPRLTTTVVIDERCAAFVALGQGRASGRPSVVICTSGTAGAHHLPAVVEASEAAIPMLLLTADRPPELQGRGALQTIRQAGLYGHFVRATWELGLPDPHPQALAGVRATAALAVHATLDPRPGPVHLNAPFRTPLEPQPRDASDAELEHLVAALGEGMGRRRGGPGLAVLLSGFLLALWAQSQVKSAYAKYTKVRNSHGMTGLQAANVLMGGLGLSLNVEGTPGQLSDHYDPRSKTLRLSQGVAQQPSVASIAIVAHELGHAMQDKTGYAPLKLRGAIVPAVRLSPLVSYFLFIFGFAMQNPTLVNVGILVFSISVVFSLITLPVEFDASRRGLKMIQSYQLLDTQEMQGAQAVLRAAALTYVAAAVQSVMTLLFYISRSRR